MTVDEPSSAAPLLGQAEPTAPSSQAQFVGEFGPTESIPMGEGMELFGEPAVIEPVPATGQPGHNGQSALENLAAHEATAEFIADDATAEDPDEIEEQEPAGPALRAQLIEQFENWLDDMLADEPPPRGLPQELLDEASAEVDEGHAPDPQADLYALFAAVTGLTGEIRLQGRAFKQLTDTLAPTAQTPDALRQLYAAQLESADLIKDVLAGQAQDRDTLPVSPKQISEVVIDLYDRLARGLQTCDDGIAAMRARPGRNWLGRLFGESRAADGAVLSARAIRDASAMTLARLQAAMSDWGIQRVGQAGEPFDSQRMTAVEARVDASTEPGTVLLVNRSGYSLNGKLMATAQVTVSKEGT